MCEISTVDLSNLERNVFREGVSAAASKKRDLVIVPDGDHNGDISQDAGNTAEEGGSGAGEARK